ncbi:MAG: chemotaxis protein CheW [Desulfuromonadales bacterium]|nr:chemotaxis protein CheW [Desulfuromonadales bacterium]MDT8423047.1 chemotaxis protein CheW [Desulfuromonadales bacterium]
MANDQHSGNEIKAVLDEMRREYWRGLEEVDHNAGKELVDYLAFVIGNENFAVPTSIAREVLRLPRQIPVPNMPEHILGVFNLRGEIIAITDLRPIFGLPGRGIPDQGKLIVMAAAGIETAIVVERVVGTRNIILDDVEPFPEGLGGIPRDAVTGQLTEDGKLTVLLDMHQLLSHTEFVIEQQ